MNPYFDIVVVGAGHAGCEAALAAARMKKKTALLTMSRNAIARMSCNPAIGGLAKGHLVREIDALGGEMGKVADKTGIQFRMLNRSKGPAVWGPRAQSDKDLYSQTMRNVVESQQGLHVIQGLVERILVHKDAVHGVALSDGQVIPAHAVLLTTGTFMGGLMHTGDTTCAGGRIGEKAANGLSANLGELGLQLGRLKTGTPPRLLKDSIDFDKTEPQYGDRDEFFFSYESSSRALPQLPCHITYTNEATHAVLRDNIHRSPMYSGRIVGVGPRYCPSVEDKVMRFADKDRHQIFLEPEGLTSQQIYVNGLSTSMPADVQDLALRSIPGLERAQILRHGYAVEYDFVLTHQTSPALECKSIKGLFFAGQVNGTSGYEEAAAQGMMAGINAVRSIDGHEPFVLRRDEAYIGVLIDDLVTKAHREPYRMFTSRAEYRLLLRQDNADMRLTKHGHDLGLVDDARFRRHVRKKERIDEETARLKTSRKGGTAQYSLLANAQNMREASTFASALMTNEMLTLYANAKYEGYIRRQTDQIRRFVHLESKRIPANIDYALLRGLKTEAKAKLAEMRPASIGQASRIAGVTPADISLLLVYLQKGAIPLARSCST